MESYVLKRPSTFALLFISAVTWTTPSFWDDAEDEPLAAAIVAEMTAEEMLAQVFFLGYYGGEPSATILRWVEERQIGGVKIFTRNVDGLTSLAESVGQMQERALKAGFRIPLFVATDQEGGWVRHVKHETSETPGNLALGATGSVRDAFLTGYYIGNELRTLGINMNFSPTTDVYSNPNASVIGPRAFSTDPVETAILSVAYFKGMEQARVIATAKHYPGHGDASKDSHGHLPVITVTFEQMWDRELVPYRFLIREGLPAIMGGHLAFPKILGDLTAASVSYFFQTTVLRDRLGFQGVMITDDMEMAGVLKGNGSTLIACEKALSAGNNMVLISHTPALQEQTWLHLRELILRDAAFKQRIEESVRRILNLKLRYFKGKNAFPLIPVVEDIDESIPTEDAEQFFFETACRSVTLIKSQDIPYRPQPKERIIAVGQFEEFLEEAQLRYPQADTLLFGYNPFYSARTQDRREIPQIAGKYDTVIFCVANFNSLDILQTLRARSKRVIVISALSPVYLKEADWVKTAIAVYGMGRASFRAGIAALHGDFEPEGKLPIDFLDAAEQD